MTQEPYPLYDAPDVYDQACCSFRDTAVEASGVQRIAAAHLGFEPKSVLDLCCGTAPNAADFVGLGYRYVGVDRNQCMLAYARDRYRDLGDRAEFRQGDVEALALPEPVDIATILSGSFFPHTLDGAVRILESVAGCLRPGGLFILEACIQAPEEDPTMRSEYSLEFGQRHLNVLASLSFVDGPRQLVEYRIRVDCTEGDAQRRFESVDRFRLLDPQEFLGVVAQVAALEFVGWWDGWDLSKPLDGRDRLGRRPVVALRKIAHARRRTELPNP